MNVLCGRSPLYRVEEFFRIRDVGLLLGEDMTSGMLNDDAIGRVLDRMYEYGTWKIFSGVCARYRLREETVALYGRAYRAVVVHSDAHDRRRQKRIEAMGLVLVLSLLLWRLMERTMRRKIKKENIMLQGWNNRDTVRPTSFMMVSKFSPVFVGVKGDRRFLFIPLDQMQLAYLSVLEVHPAVFTKMGSSTGSIRSGYH